MKYILFVFILLNFVDFSWAQSIEKLSLEEAFQLAKEKYPSFQQNELHDKLHELQIQKLDKEKMPQLNLIGKGTIQTHSLSLPFALPGMEEITLPLVNIQTYGEATFMLYDGGVHDVKKELLTTALQTKKQAAKVEWESMKMQITQSFFAALLLRKQKAVVELAQTNLQQRIDFLQAGFDNGVVLESDLLKIKVKYQQLQAQINELDNNIISALKSLSYLIGNDISTNAVLASGIGEEELFMPIHRAEQKMFALQKQQILSQEKMIAIKGKPKLTAFLRLGAGYPNPLNLFDNNISPFGIGGLQFRWRIWDWGMDDLERQQLTIQSQLVDVQKSSFEYRLNAANARYEEELKKIKMQIQDEQKIVELQKSIEKQLAAQLEHGVITTTEYLQQVNATLQASLKLETRYVQLQQTRAAYWTLRGKY